MSQMKTEEKSFSKLRAFFWPVHRHELKKLIPMLFIFFLLSFDYNVLRCMKDTLVVTAKNSGAEVIPFIKVWVMFPTSVLLTFLYIRLSNRFEKETVFYSMLSLFLGFFALFAYYLYPQRESIHLHNVADRLSEILPIGFKGFIAMIRYWSFTLFYVMSELWGNIVLFLLFWGFANQVTKLDEARRFYGLFGIGTNFSGILAGQLSILVVQLGEMATFTNNTISSANHEQAWERSLFWLVTMVLIAGIASMALFKWLNVTLQNHPELSIDEVGAKKLAEKQEKKPKYSMRENIRYLMNSKYMLYLVTIVVSYNIIINLVEILWKHEVRELYPDPRSYNMYMNQVTTIIGIMATLVALFVSSNSLRFFGWTATAMITPMILLVTSVGFFGFFFLKETPSITESLFIGFSPLSLVVFFGTLQNCLSRAAKYTVFDATKEMVFIPLSKEEKIKGKAAVDGICQRLGKSGGSVIYQALLVFVSTITASVPYVALILFTIIGIWIFAVRKLGKQFNQKIHPEPARYVPVSDAPTITTKLTTNLAS